MVFTDQMPPDTMPPFILVQTQTSTPVFADVGTWESLTALIEIVGEAGEVAWLHSFASEVRRYVSTLRGATASNVVVQSIGQISAAFGLDPGYTPALPRWVLTIPMIARNAAPN